MAEKRQRTLSRDQRVEIRFLEKLRQRNPEDAGVLRALGDLYTGVGRIEDGLQVDLELSQLCPGESEVWYNLGCSYALVGRADDAFAALTQAVEQGYTDARWMQQDSDLTSLRGDPRFKLLLSRVIR